MQLFLNTQKVTVDIQDSFARANNVAEEVISSMRTVRSFANEETESEHYATKLKHTHRLFYKKAIIRGSWVWSNNVRQHLTGMNPLV